MNSIHYQLDDQFTRYGFFLSLRLTAHTLSAPLGYPERSTFPVPQPEGQKEWTSLERRVSRVVAEVESETLAR